MDGDLEALDPEPASETASHATPPRRAALLVGVAVVAAAVGSFVTYTLIGGSDRAAVISPVPTSVSTSGTDDATFSIGDVVSLDAWRIAVTNARVAATYAHQRMPGRKWVVVTAALSHLGAGALDFWPQMVRLRLTDRRYQGVDGEFVDAQTGTVWEVSAQQTITAELAFSVPDAAQQFSLVIRRSLDADERQGGAREILLQS